MLDVHVPHKPAHTFADFCIHIATIVVGLLIALGLEQAVESIHHRTERRHLERDLREEAEERVRVTPTNLRSHEASTAWLRASLAAAQRAKPSAGAVEFVLPPDSLAVPNIEPHAAAWAAAKASGTVEVLPRLEIEAWERVDYFTQHSRADGERASAAYRALMAKCDRLGITLRPGSVVHLRSDNLDQLLDAISTLIEATEALQQADRILGSVSEATLHGAFSDDAMSAYITRALTTPGL